MTVVGHGGRWGRLYIPVERRRRRRWRVRDIVSEYASDVDRTSCVRTFTWWRLRGQVDQQSEGCRGKEDVTWHGMAWMAWHGMAWRGVAWRGMAWRRWCRGRRKSTEVVWHDGVVARRMYHGMAALERRQQGAGAGLRAAKTWSRRGMAHLCGRAIDMLVVLQSSVVVNHHHHACRA